jgi:PAS domain S-box-containing protein
MLHPLLQRQLQRARVDVASATAESLALFERISQAYADADLERYRLERSITICSDEMSELNARLLSERDLFRAIFESAAVGMARASLDGVILDCNDAYAKMLGHAPTELVGRRWIELLHRDEQDSASTAAGGAGHPSLAMELRHAHRDGSTVFATVNVSTVRDAAGTALFHIAVVRDITQQKHLEIELRHAQRLESVGRLAAGIAHEINTPVQFVGDNLSFVRESLDALLKLYAQAGALVGADGLRALSEGEEAADLAYVREHLPRAIDESLEGIDRVAEIVKAMKFFAHQEHTEDQANVDLEATLNSVLTVARSETRFVADVSLDLGDVASIVGYPNHLNQVFLGLVVNAAHAVGDVVGRTNARGTICVRTRRDRDHVVVSVEDTGSGIPESIRHRIFDPFFTTKEVGRGTGQGLALARSIVVDKHGGTLTFESEVGRGTTFRVRLPIRGRPRAPGQEAVA